MRERLVLVMLIALAGACGLVRAGVSQTTVDAPRNSRGHGWDLNPLAGGVSYAIYPTQRIPMRFDHARHMQIAGVSCVSCHQIAAESTLASDRLVPSEQTCTPCHDIRRNEFTRVAQPSARCDACHVGFDPATPLRVQRIDFPPSNLVFSHRAHVTRGARCESCHGDMRTVSLATRLELPTMQSCFTCHREGGTARSACVECHLAQSDGTIRTRFAEGWLNPPQWMTGLHHDADFWVNHRTTAADNGARCATCHRESDCIECHDGRVRDRRNHPNDYVNLHPAEARSSSHRCTSCHRAATFCEACHLRMGVAEDSPANSRAAGRFHPPSAEWSGATVTPRHHAIEARRSMTACVSCHSERDCTTCHAATGMGGAGISPHPPGWLDRCGAMLRASSRACAQCHADLDAVASQCR